jgi:hypothetical protein
MIGAPSTSATCSSSSAAPSAPRPAMIATLRPAFRISAAWRTSSSAGSHALRAKTFDTWCGMFRFVRFRLAGASWMSVGRVMWLTPR